MNIEINRINDEITKKPSEFVHAVNEAYMYHLNEIVDNIAKNRHEKPVVLLSGPSGSGKTTTAMMIESISEKINLIFETIIPNIKKIDISNMLSLIEMFIECYIEKDNNNISKIIVNFIENINLELNNLLKNKNEI